MALNISQCSILFTFIIFVLDESGVAQRVLIYHVTVRTDLLILSCIFGFNIPLAMAQVKACQSQEGPGLCLGTGHAISGSQNFEGHWSSLNRPRLSIAFISLLSRTSCSSLTLGPTCLYSVF
jgi:hypothetical protein